MIGSQFDLLGRLKAVLPGKWFPNTPVAQQQNVTITDTNGNYITDYSGNPLFGGALPTVIASNSPVLDGLLSGVSWVWSQSYALLQYVKLQTRIATASGMFLDIIALDFFGTFIARRNAETDTSLRTRIKKELFRQKGTRAGLISALTDLTGRVPVVFEPAYTLDTKGWDQGALGWDTAGGWGDLSLPFQCFVIAYRPSGGGLAIVAGWGDGVVGMPGGWDVGAIEWASLDSVASPVSDAVILNTINDVKPAATIAWTSIRS